MSFLYVTANGIKTSPQIEGIGLAKGIRDSRFGPCVRNGFAIHYNIKGTGFLNGYPVKSGQGFLIHNGMYAEHHADENDPWELLWITVSGDLVDEIFRTYPVDPSTQIFDYGSPSYTAEIVQRITGLTVPWLDSLELLEMFLRLHRYSMPQASRADASDAARMYLEHTLKYIQSNLCRPLRVEELSAHIGIERSYLYKLFRRTYGISPKQYIIQAKLELAKHLLLDTDMSITAIAASVGYGDVLCFSKMFSSQEKISPQGYRSNRGKRP